MTDKLKRLKHVDRTNEIEEPIFRDLRNFMYLSDIQSAQLEILTGAIERAFQACADGTLTQAEVNDVINSRKALKKPNIIEKSLESEAMYFSHCVAGHFVAGIAGEIHDHHQEKAQRHPMSTVYDHARRVAEFVTSMYYDVDIQLGRELNPARARVTFLDPSGTMTNKTILQRILVTTKAANAVQAWAGKSDVNTHFVGWYELFYEDDWRLLPNFRFETEDGYGHLTDAGKANLRAAILAADPTRLSPAPSVSAPIADMSLQVSGTESADIALVFYDDGDILTYVVSSADPAIATAALSGTTLTVTAVAVGATTVSLTATDSDGQAVTDTFEVEVSERSGV